MIGYVTLGTNNFDAAVKFYDDLLASLGADRVFESDAFVAWSTSSNSPALSVAKPHNKEPATVGNGVMVAIAVREPAQVDVVHAKALELGGSDEGAPGDRGNGFYAGYFRDLDGNKLNAFCMIRS